jgi:hypothetical protein
MQLAVAFNEAEVLMLDRETVLCDGPFHIHGGETRLDELDVPNVAGRTEIAVVVAWCKDSLGLHAWKFLLNASQKFRVERVCRVVLFGSAGERDITRSSNEAGLGSEADRAESRHYERCPFEHRVRCFLDVKIADLDDGDMHVDHQFKSTSTTQAEDGAKESGMIPLTGGSSRCHVGARHERLDVRFAAVTERSAICSTTVRVP